VFDLLYLDAPSLVYRAYFALPTTLTDEGGRPVNAVRGFMDMVARLLVDHRPDALVAAFDSDWRPAFRVEAYPGYKAERPQDPADLPGQFEVVAEVLDAAGVSRAEAPGLEADDALATLLERKPPGPSVALVTGDRDLLALVRDPDVRVLWPERGMKVLTQFDETAVESKFGVPPRLYPDFATLRGDPSDGLPGIAGIGPVRAAKLLSEHGSLPGILQHLDRLPARQAEALREAQDYLAAMQVVVTLRRDAELEITEPHAPDQERLLRLSAEHNLEGPTNRLLRSLAGAR
jgi:5'-3' exonuclease